MYKRACYSTAYYSKAIHNTQRHTRTLMLTHRTTTEHRGQSCACACMQGIGAFREISERRKQRPLHPASHTTSNRFIQSYFVPASACIKRWNMCILFNGFQVKLIHTNTGCHAYLLCIIYFFQFRGSYNDRYSVGELKLKVAMFLVTMQLFQ